MEDSPARRAGVLEAAALELAGRGWPVFPLRPRRHEPAIRDWEARATTDPAIIRRTWEIAPWNVGVACGPAGLVVLNLHRGPPGDHGRQHLAQLAAQAGSHVPAETHTVLTPSGGEQLYFAAGRETVPRSTVRISPRVTASLGGSYVVGAGSVIDGKRYRVVAGAEVMTLPPWLASLVGVPVAVQPQPTSVNRSLEATIARELRRVEEALAGNRNHTLFVAAVRLGRLVNAGGLGEAQVRAALTQAADRHQPPGVLTSREIRRAIDAGLRHYATPQRNVLGAAGHGHVPGAQVGHEGRM